ncbi:hypothetical protein N0V93_000997 [Gnomoniopsis smithogilvyi]|uniref:Rhodopsin domain-containing protein n=1 Tax=Gnomoniopsis smithogilvyi TaxID=1191159 RepID=A0A9W8Z382_9PEZI|nr:hypothetical protein N0V93_000997 [Gnomoniopsis smithogilvyi]
MGNSSFVAEAFTLLGVGLSIIGLRTSLRYNQVGVRKFQADDYLIIVAAVIYSAETFLAYSVGVYWDGIANNGMTAEERKSLNPSSYEYHLRVNGSKTQLAGWSTYTLLLWTLKACMCTFYLRLTEGLEGFSTKIYIGFGLVISTWLAVLFGILFGCGLPFEKNWQIYPEPSNYCQPAISRVDIYMTVVLNVLTDFYLMSIPLPLLWKARVSGLKRIAMVFCFSGGLFVTAAGVLRCVLIVTDEVNGAQLAGSWAVRETFVAVVTTNLPMLSPLIQTSLRVISSERIRCWLALSSWSRRKDSGNRSSQMRESRSIHLGTYSSSKQRSREPKSMYHITAWSESEERIMGMTGQCLQQEMRRKRVEEAATFEGDEPASQLGGIQQQVEVTVTREASTLSAAELERRQTLGYIVHTTEDVGTSATCQSAASQYS